jgi:SM-20-related protein
MPLRQWEKIQELLRPDGVGSGSQNEFAQGANRMTTTSDVSALFNPFLVKDFFDARTCEEIIAEMRSAESAPATIHGASSSVDERVRKAARVMPSQATVELVRRRLFECKGQVEEHFRISLSDCEEPQFLRYQVGDFFVAHQDGNTPLIHDDSRFRKISAIIFLSASSPEPLPGTFGGGVLTFHDPEFGSPRRLPLTPPPGTFVAFRAETTHEVTPVTHGERFTIVSWYRARADAQR